MDDSRLPAAIYRGTPHPAAMDGWCALCRGEIKKGALVRFDSQAQYIHPEQMVCASYLLQIKVQDAKKFLKSVGIAPE